MGAFLIKRLLLWHLQITGFRTMQAGSLPSPHFILSQGCFRAGFGLLLLFRRLWLIQPSFSLGRHKGNQTFTGMFLGLRANISPTATSSATAGRYWGWAHLPPGWEARWALLVCEKLSATLVYTVKRSEKSEVTGIIKGVGMEDVKEGLGQRKRGLTILREECGHPPARRNFWKPFQVSRPDLFIGRTHDSKE